MLRTIEEYADLALSNLEAGNSSAALHMIDIAIRMRAKAKQAEQGIVSEPVETLTRFLLNKHGSAAKTVKWIDRNVDTSWPDWVKYQDARVYLERWIAKLVKE